MEKLADSVTVLPIVRRYEKRISLQNTRLPLYLQALARDALPHCAHDTELPRVQKIHTKLGGYGQ